MLFRSNDEFSTVLLLHYVTRSNVFLIPSDENRHSRSFTFAPTRGLLIVEKPGTWVIIWSIRGSLDRPQKIVIALRLVCNDSIVVERLAKCKRLAGFSFCIPLAGFLSSCCSRAVFFQPPSLGSKYYPIFSTLEISVAP